MKEVMKMSRSLSVSWNARGAALGACVWGLTSLAGCADTLEPEPAAGVDAGPIQSSGNFQNSEATGGVIVTVVDATDESAWQHLDLDTGAAADGEPSWDLAFSRFRVRVNGGVTGEGGARAAFTSQAFESVTEPPMDTEWMVPVPDGEDDGDEPDNVFNNGEDDWYDYDPSTHTLTPKARTYLIATTEQRFFKLAFESYYDDAGTPALVRFRWAEIGAVALDDAGQAMVPDAGMPQPDSGGPEVPAGAIEIEASSRDSWTYYKVGAGIVTIETPEESLEWDVAFQRTAIRTNSGTSGPGVGGLREEAETEGVAGYEGLAAASTFGFLVDEEVTSGPPGTEPFSASPVEWFNYNPANHSVAPKDTALVLRTADGGYAKLRIWTWASGVYMLSVDPIERYTAARTIEVDASDGTSWTHISLRDGALVTLEGEAAEDLGWDLAISRTLFRSNSGTSGAGQGGAVLLGELALADVATMPAEGFTEDETITPERPGAMPYSGNTVLADWFDYNPMTHSVTPKPVSFAVRAADASLAAVQVISYADGVVTVAVRYAGPGQTSL